MDKLNFVQIGGFPLKAERLQEMQTAYELLNALGELAGNKSIIRGCVQTGTTVSDGVIYLNGEVFRFVGGNVQTTIRILQTPKVRAFQNGEQKEVHYERYATFASGVGSIPWEDFKRAESLLSLQGRLLPPGTNPQIYTGAVANIPAGWQLCDGTNGTPDMRGAFVVGYNPDDTDYNAIGKTGGEKQVGLNISQLPAHYFNTVGGQYVNNGNNFEVTSLNTIQVRGDQKGDYHRYQLQGTNMAADKGRTNTIGSNQKHENRPPYYTVAYIIYTGN